MAGEIGGPGPQMPQIQPQPGGAKTQPGEVAGGGKPQAEEFTVRENAAKPGAFGAKTTEPKMAGDQADLKTGNGTKAAEPSAAVKERAKSATDAAMKAYDKDGSGGIDAGELDNWIKEKGGDAQKTGEFTNTDGDLKLSKDEIQNAYGRQFGAEEAKANSADGIEAAAGKKGAESADNAIKDKRVDTDGDGKVGKEELAKWAGDAGKADSLLKQNDADGDGKLDQKELSNAYKSQYGREGAKAVIGQARQDARDLNDKLSTLGKETVAKAINEKTTFGEAAKGNPEIAKLNQEFDAKIQEIGKLMKLAGETEAVIDKPQLAEPVGDFNVNNNRLFA